MRRMLAIRVLAAGLVVAAGVACDVRDRAADDVAAAGRTVEFCSALLDFRQALSDEDHASAVEVGARLTDLVPDELRADVDRRLTAVRAAANGDLEALEDDDVEAAATVIDEWAADRCNVQIDDV